MSLVNKLNVGGTNYDIQDRLMPDTLGNANQVLKVNSTGDALVFADAASAGVSSFGGQTGAITLDSGNGLTMNGSVLKNNGITKIGNATGDITLGTNLSMSGNTLNATGGSGSSLYRHCIVIQFQAYDEEESVTAYEYANVEPIITNSATPFTKNTLTTYMISLRWTATESENNHIYIPYLKFNESVTFTSYIDEDPTTYVEYTAENLKTDNNTSNIYIAIESTEGYTMLLSDTRVAIFDNVVGL